MTKHGKKQEQLQEQLQEQEQLHEQLQTQEQEQEQLQRLQRLQLHLLQPPHLPHPPHRPRTSVASFIFSLSQRCTLSDFISDAFSFFSSFLKSSIHFHLRHIMGATLDL